MKNLNILRIHWKIQLLVRGSRKTNMEGGLPKKGGCGEFVDLRGTWQERGGFHNLMHTMSYLKIIWHMSSFNIVLLLQTDALVVIK